MYPVESVLIPCYIELMRLGSIEYEEDSTWRLIDERKWLKLRSA